MLKPAKLQDREPVAPARPSGQRPALTRRPEAAPRAPGAPKLRAPSEAWLLRTLAELRREQRWDRKPGEEQTR